MRKIILAAVAALVLAAPAGAATVLHTFGFDAIYGEGAPIAQLSGTATIEVEEGVDSYSQPATVSFLVGGAALGSFSVNGSYAYYTPQSSGYGIDATDGRFFFAVAVRPDNRIQGNEYYAAISYVLNGVIYNPLDARATTDGTIPVAMVPAAVPEPASWALLIAGFGLVGSELRRRLPALDRHARHG